jgi:predicted lysophospholipase L1 biosynthesis ABC-type transport system permease subunit
MLEETEGLIKYVTLGTLDKRTTTNITQRHNTTQNTKKIRKADPSNNRWLTHVIAKGKQFLSLIGLHAFFPEFIYV